MAIAQAIAEIRKGNNFVGVLDLKQAYDMVERRKLLKLLDNRLPQDLASMISALLTPLNISTVGDPTNLKATIFRRVVQGSPLIPVLFNIYIDELATRLQVATAPHSSQLPEPLYADDILLHLPNIPLLKLALKEFDQWAQANGMRCGIPKCKVLIPKDQIRQSNTIKIAGEQIPVARRAKYLGVDIEREGVRTERSISRTAAAKRRMRLMESQSTLSHNMHPKTLIRTYKSLIRPLSEHALALVPLNPALKNAINKVGQAFFGMILRREKVSVGNLRTLCAPISVRRTRTETEIALKSTYQVSAIFIEYGRRKRPYATQNSQNAITADF